MENYKFEPSQELLDFANDFSDRWEKLSDGNYFSKNNNYEINIDDSKNTFFRISHQTKIIQVSTSKIHELEVSPDYIFYTILWCEIEWNVINYEMADKIAIEYYLTTGRPIKKIIEGSIKLFNNYNSQRNMSRTTKIMKLTKLKYEPKFNKNRIRILL